jgi:hypothetical protein
MSARPDRLAATNRLTEMVAVVLLGIATIGTAWCGYQSSRWNAEQQDLGREASDFRVEANRQFGLATQQVQYDANLLAQYARAVSDGDTRLQEFFRTSMMRAEFVPLLDEWQAEVQAGGSPGNLLDDEGYLDAQLGGYQDTQRRAEETDVEAREAGENGDDYVLMTLMLATALFFAGVTTSFKVRAARLVLLACATASIAYALSRIATLPVA